MQWLGVTGHRILARKREIVQGIEQSLIKIKDAFLNEDWGIVSALAEGTDCLVVEKAISMLGARLITVLPLPIHEYVKAFTTPQAQDVFYKLFRYSDSVVSLPPYPSPNIAYQAAGRYIIEHCTILLSVWDGKDAQGIGGTGEIVRFARDRGLPIAWVQAGNRLPDTLEPSDLGLRQGMVVFERFPNKER